MLHHIVAIQVPDPVQAEELALARQGGFVADRSPVDFAAFWLHYRFAHAREETEQFFAATRPVPTSSMSWTTAWWAWWTR